jgi:hypothetical protein
MLFNLHNDYVKSAAAAPRSRAFGEAWSHARHSEPPPRPVRARVARALVAAAVAVDREAARRAEAA